MDLELLFCDRERVGFLYFGEIQGGGLGKRKKMVGVVEDLDEILNLKRSKFVKLKV